LGVTWCPDEHNYWASSVSPARGVSEAYNVITGTSRKQQSLSLTLNPSKIGHLWLK